MTRSATRVLNLVELISQRERTLLIVILVSITAGCWAWIAAMARDMYGSMEGWSSWMMSQTWDITHLLLLWAMWAAMMTAMMLPAALPILLLYLRSGRARDDDSRVLGRVLALAAGYLAVWAIFSVGATVLQRLLAEGMLMSPMMEPATDRLGAVLLVVAGIYQITPLKRMCLRACRSPMTFLMTHWRSGTGGAFGMGIRHGLYCLGCCWALMLLLFAGGVMNLAVIVALTAWILVEKLLPLGDKSAIAIGLLLLGAGMWRLLA